VTHSGSQLKKYKLAEGKTHAMQITVIAVAIFSPSKIISATANWLNNQLELA
jgi:hypothetical protein